MGIMGVAWGTLIPSLFTNLVFLVVGILVLLLSPDYLHRENINLSEYYVLVLAATCGMMLMGTSSSLMTIFLALELFSICLYVLAGFARVRPKSQEAAVKYFLLSAFASGFLLYGMALTYGETGSTQLATINSFLATHASAADPVLLVGMGLMIVGLSFKMAAVPFHVWTPDVYEGSPGKYPGENGHRGAAELLGTRQPLFLKAAAEQHLRQLGVDNFRAE